MHDAVSSGEILASWLAPFAHFLLDVVFAAFVLTLLGVLFRGLERVRRRRARPAPSPDA